MDDRELEDENDDNDAIVDINGYLQTKSRIRKYSDELANGDTADDRDIHEEEDMNDDVVDVNGQTNWGYGSMVPSKYVAQNHIMPGTFITTPRSLAQLSQKHHHKHRHPKRHNKVQLRKYSDELANGDSADNRDIHEEEDTNDDVVDENGHTNRGYGSMNPHKYRAQNHIFPGHFITNPRD